jgi:hypothetical protein
LSAATPFSSLPNAGIVKVGDEIVGIRAAVDSRFTFPADGFQDTNSNYIMKWSSAGAAAVNSLLITSSIATQPVVLSVQGTDVDIDLVISGKGSGEIVPSSPVNLSTAELVSDLNVDIIAKPAGTGQLKVNANNAMTIPVGTLAQRPAGVAGDIRMNTDSNTLEFFDGAAWVGLNNSIFRVEMPANQSIPNNVATKVDFNTITIDTNSDYDIALDRFVPTIPGFYRVDSIVTWITTATVTTWSIAIFKNGVIAAASTMLTSASSNPGAVSLMCEDIISMNGTTDFIEIFATQNSGAAANILAAPDISTFKGARIIG